MKYELGMYRPKRKPNRLLQIVEVTNYGYTVWWYIHCAAEDQDMFSVSPLIQHYDFDEVEDLWEKV